MRGVKPGHESTGSRGYFANRGSSRERSQSENDDPRVFPTMRWYRQASHRPRGGDAMAPILYFLK